jgi:hypothetical protein
VVQLAAVQLAVKLYRVAQELLQLVQKHFNQPREIIQGTSNSYDLNRNIRIFVCGPVMACRQADLPFTRSA